MLNLLKQTVRYFKKFDSKLDPVGVLLASTASFICLLLFWDNGFYTIDSVGYYKSAWWFSEIVKIKLAVLLGSDNINMFDPIHNESYLKLFSSPGNYVTNVGYAFAKRGGIIFLYALPIAIAKMFSFPPTVLLRLVQILMFSLMAYFVYRIGEQVYNKTAGVIASIFLILGTFVITNTFVLWTHLPSSFFVTAALLGYVKYRESNSDRWLFVSGFCTASAMMMRFVNFWLFLPLAAFLFYDFLQDRKRNFVWYYVSYMGTSAIFVLYLYKLYDYNRYFWNKSYSMNFISGIDTIYEMQVLTLLCIMIAPIVAAYAAFYVGGRFTRSGVNSKYLNGSFVLGLFIFLIIAVVFVMTQSNMIPGANYYESSASRGGFGTFIHYEGAMSILEPTINNLFRWDGLYEGQLITSSLLESSPFFVLALFGVVTLARHKYEYFVIFSSFTLAVIVTIIIVFPYQTWAYNVRFFHPFVPILCILSAIPASSVAEATKRFFVSGKDSLIVMTGVVISIVVPFMFFRQTDVIGMLRYEIFTAYGQVWSRGGINTLNRELAVLLFVAYLVYRVFVLYSASRESSRVVYFFKRFFTGIVVGLILVAFTGAFLNNVYMDTANPVIAFKYDIDPGYCVINTDIMHAHHTERGTRVLPILDWFEKPLNPVWLGFQDLVEKVILPENVRSKEYRSNELFPGNSLRSTPPLVSILFIINSIVMIGYLSVVVKSMLRRDQ